MGRDVPAVVDFVMPVYNEGANVGRAIEEIDKNVPLPKRVLVVYDFDEDNTVPAVRELQPRYPWVELVKNTIGRGVLNAVRAGIAATSAEVVIVTMADLSDDVSIVPKMVGLIRDEGYDIVCASRYMKGGQQIGGPKFKKFLSRMAGISLHWLSGLPTHDATNAFRAYRRSVLQETTIESTGVVRIFAGDHRQGLRAGPADHRGPLDLARPLGRAVAVQAPGVAAALPEVVPLCPDPSAAAVGEVKAGQRPSFASGRTSCPSRPPKGTNPW